MTNEEASLVLDNARPETAEYDKGFYDDEDLNTAINMAMEALKDRPKGETYEEIINFYLNGLVETYKKMGYTIIEISITEKNSLSPTIYEFGEKGGESE